MTRGWPATLQHGDITVRPLSRRDAALWAKLRATNAPWLAPWEATTPPGGAAPPSSYSTLISMMRRRARTGQIMPFAVTYRGEMVGQITVNGITQGSACWASIGYWIAQSAAGQSITPTGVALVCDHLFNSAKLHRIEIAIRPENHPSIRVVEKLGFTEYGYAPKYLHIAGDWRDHRLYQLLVEDVQTTVLDRLLNT